MTNYSELKRKAQEIRDEVKTGANTASRVGLALEETVNALEAENQRAEQAEVSLENAVQLLQDETEDLPGIRETLDTLVINDLTTGGADKALSAEMGVTLNSALASVKKRVTEESTDSEKDELIVQTDTGETIVSIDEDGVKTKRLFIETTSGYVDVDKKKQNVLTFDVEPTIDSSNPVTSDGVARAIMALPTPNMEDTTDDGDYISFETEDGMEVARVDNSGISTPKSLYKRLNGVPTFNKYIYGTGATKDADSLLYITYDVSYIDTVVIDSIMSDYVGIPLWFGFKDGTFVKKGEVYTTGDPLRHIVVDCRDIDTLCVNGQKNGKIYVSRLISNIMRYIYDSASGDTYLFLGDSLTQGVGATAGHDAVTYVGNMLGCDVLNAGIGGTTMHNDGRGANLYKIVESFISGDWTDVNNFIQSTLTGDAKDRVSARFDIIQQTKFQEITAIVIAYGANDWKSGATLDNEDNGEDVTTVCGSLRYAVRRFYELSPSVRIYVVSPGYREAEEDTPEVSGVSMREFCHTIEETCADLHIPCWNQYLDNGINKYNSTLYLSDGTHRSALGYELLASQYVKFIKNHY